MELLKARDVRIMVFLFAVTAGIGLSRTGWIPSIGLVVLAGLVLFAVIVNKRPVMLMLCIVASGLVLGNMRGSGPARDLMLYRDYIGEKITLSGTIADDPVRADGGQREFYLHKIKSPGGRDLIGKARISGYGGDGLRRGDIVEVNGKLRDGFGPYQAQISYGEITPIARPTSQIEDFRSNFFAAVNSSVSDPESALGLGFVVGLRALLPDDLLDTLSRTGLTHIVAVSGYNLTIMIRLTRRLFARRSRFLAAAASTVLVILFLAITGLVPSVFRASIVAGASLGAWYYGLKVRPLTLIALGSAITAWINPLFIWSDVGWWLSFLAFFGVMIIAPTITDLIYKKRAPGLIEQICIETTSAQLMALPFIAYVFGEISAISVIANIAVTPLIPLAMLLVTIAGVARLLFVGIAGWLAWPAQQLLSAMLELTEILAAVPWALAEIKISQASMLLMYLVIVITLVGLRRGREQISGAYLVQ